MSDADLQPDHPVDHEGAWRYAVERLERELPSQLHYHSLKHTRDDVVPATERLAGMEGVNGQNRIILLTAAFFHDLGFVELSAQSIQADIVRSQHEDISTKIAGEVLPQYGYSAEQVEAILRLIQVTKLPQRPRTLLEKIIADADLDSLGRTDYWPTSNALRKELAAYGRICSDKEWYEVQLRFLCGHEYFTASARLLRDAQKRQNIKEVLERVEALQS